MKFGEIYRVTLIFKCALYAVFLEFIKSAYALSFVGNEVSNPH